MTQSTVLSHFALVAAMNVAFGNRANSPVDYLPMEGVQPGVIGYDHAVWGPLTKQCTNIGHEITELEAAMADDYDEHVRDALCDIRVFAYGGLHFMGIEYCEAHSYPASQYEHWAESFLRRADPITALRMAFCDVMHQISAYRAHDVVRALAQMVYTTEQVGLKLGYSAACQDSDMRLVVEAVMTRFIKDGEDLKATIAKHKAKGITDVYFEGEFPTMIMKSAKDQPDAPAGKFLKSASFSEPKFPEYQRDLSVAGVVVVGATIV